MENISCILQLTDRAKFMASSLSNLVNNLSEGIPKIKCKYGDDNKNCKTCHIKYKHCDCSLVYIYILQRWFHRIQMFTLQYELPKVWQKVKETIF